MKAIMISWSDFSDLMNDILSSGQGSGDMTGWHEEQLKDLFDKVHANDVGTFVNRYYADIEPCEVLGGELSYIGGLIDSTVVSKITFVAN